MARRAEKREEHHWPLVVEPATLRALALEMQKFLAAPGTDPNTISLDLTVFFSDGFRQSFTGVEDVISLENPAWCSISGLLLVAETRSAMISCQLGPRGSGTSVRVAGPERDWVYDCCRRVKERIRAMSRLMPPRVYMSPSLAVFAVMTFGLLGALFWFGSGTAPMPAAFFSPVIFVFAVVAYSVEVGPYCVFRSS